MARDLQQYNQKRDFDKTGEPFGKLGKKAHKLRFVVQHHIASRDHFDFRLEWEGALKSWAVPKGPSPNPADKRLAVQVEDHPLNYRNFEGTIPKGEYGGGTVMLWDEGDYDPLVDMNLGLQNGSLKFELKGKRLRGKWALVRMAGEKKENNWLLIKEKDGSSKASQGIGQFKTSVRSGRTMAEISTGNIDESTKNPFTSADVQLARLMSAVPEDDGWLYEIKYDGYRILAYIEAGKVVLRSRNGNDYTHKFKAVAEAFTEWSADRAMVLDGEMIVTDAQGRPDFQALQKYIKNPAGQLRYMLFDILALDGKDLRGTPLSERKEVLARLLEGAPDMLCYSSHIQGQGAALLQQACAAQLEGIIGKRAGSVYSGTRNGDWIKIKCAARQEFVIGGYTRSAKRAAGISSLLLGVNREGELIYCGRAGGFSERDIAELEKKFQPIIRKTSPFQETPKNRSGETLTWLRPSLAAEVAFAEWTQEGHLRQAKFKGLRADKEIAQIKREECDEVEHQKNACVIEGVKLTHPNKVLIKEPEVTKEDLALYYQLVAPRMLPFLQGRVISAIRCPGGAKSPCFFKKHPGADNEGIVPVEITNSKGETESYYSIADVYGLISEVQMNSVEFHTWGSRAAQLETPDVMVFDLDPDEGMALDAVRQGVKDLKSILDELALKSYLKTSGGKGYHIVVPFSPYADWEAFRAFAKGIAGLMETKWPERYVSNVRKANRKDKIFVDWIRNTRGATSAAPYSVRARKGAPVSMPIAWSELAKIAPDGINMAEAVKRLRRKDPWADFFENPQRLST